MTCIIGLVDKKNVYIGGDSAGVNLNDYSYVVRKDPKVFRNGNMIFGFSTSFRMGQLLRYSLDIPIPSKEYKGTDFDFLCTVFIDSIISCFKRNGYASIDNNFVTGGSFLLGYNKRLYTVCDDFQVSESVRPFEAIGCAADSALGAMDILYKNTRLSSKTKIFKSLEVAESFSTGVKSPFTIVRI